MKSASQVEPLYLEPSHQPPLWSHTDLGCNEQQIVNPADRNWAEKIAEEVGQPTGETVIGSGTGFWWIFVP